MRTLVCVVAWGLSIVAGGCGPAGPVPVTGRVTFQGQPVTEGYVQFLNLKTSKGTDAALGPDGGYALSIPAGVYAIVIFPPTIQDTTYGLAYPRLKKMDNVPSRYSAASSSGLRVEVDADKATHDFDLKP